jgi:hypothetical protein
VGFTPQDNSHDGKSVKGLWLSLMFQSLIISLSNKLFMTVQESHPRGEAVNKSVNAFHPGRGEMFIA